jgi:hypothetical protein
MYFKLNDYIIDKFKDIKFEVDDCTSLNEKLNAKVLKLNSESKTW